MTLNELKGGMVVKTRNGNQYIYMGDRFVREKGYNEKCYYNDDLTHTIMRDFDIVKVYSPITSLNDFIIDDMSHSRTIWEREEKPAPLFKVGDIIANPDGEYGLVIGVEESEESPDYNGYTLLEPCDDHSYCNVEADTFFYTEYELVSSNFKKLTTRTQLYDDFDSLVEEIRFEYNNNGEA